MKKETQQAVDSLIASLEAPNSWTITDGLLTHKVVSSIKIAIGCWWFETNLRPVPLALTWRQKWQLRRAVKKYIAITITQRLDNKESGSVPEQKDQP